MGLDGKTDLHDAEAEQDKVNGIIASTRDTINVYSGQIEDGEAAALAYEAAIKAKEQDLAYLKAKLAEEMRYQNYAGINSLLIKVCEVEVKSHMSRSDIVIFAQRSEWTR